jgi:outer membrane protein
MFGCLEPYEKDWLMLRWNALVVFSLGIPTAAAAQDTTGVRPTLDAGTPIQVTVSLQDALDQARAMSPALRQVLNDQRPADWAVRNAWSTLFLPSLTASSGLSYTGTGESRFGGGLTNRAPAFVSSNYFLGLNWALSGRTVTGPGLQKANSRAVEADINNADISLKGDITDQYLAVLQATAQVEVARQQVGRNQIFLDLAEARFQLGQATLLDVRQAEATHAQSRSNLIVAEQTENAAKLEIFRRMGIHPPISIQSIGFSSTFEVTEPTFDMQSLLDLAERENPALSAFRAREDAAAWNSKAAKSDFLPTVSARASWSGFTQQFTDENTLLSANLFGSQNAQSNCNTQNQINAGAIGPLPQADCSSGNFGLTPDGSALTAQTQQDIIDQNNVFPLDYTSSPFSASLTVSLPIFTGFNRSLAVARAESAQMDADESVRAAELQVRAVVTERYLALNGAYQAVGIQELSRSAAREQLRLAQDRYRLGSGNATELSDAQNAVALAEGNYVNAVYAYHRALTALEVAIGRPLR